MPSSGSSSPFFLFFDTFAGVDVAGVVGTQASSSVIEGIAAACFFFFGFFFFD